MSKSKLPKEKSKSIDLYFSYHLKSTEHVKALYNILYYNHNYEIYMNAVQSNKSNQEQLDTYLSDTKCVLCFITKKYSETDNCKNEIIYARNNKIPIIVLMLEKVSTKDLGEVGSIISLLTRLYFYDKVLKETDFSKIWEGETFDSLIKSIRKIAPLIPAKSAKNQTNNKDTKLKRNKSKDRSNSELDSVNTTISSDPAIDLYFGKEQYPNGDRYEGELSNLSFSESFLKHFLKFFLKAWMITKNLELGLIFLVTVCIK